MLLGEIVTSVVGLVIGLVTGFYFERRATRDAQAENADLRRQLRELRESIYSVGGDGGAGTQPAPTATGDISGAILGWAEAVQDSSGRVRKSHLIMHFLGAGHSRSEIDEALSRLCDSGAVRLEQTWVEIA